MVFILYTPTPPIHIRLKCDTFYSNDSGLIEFAKICGVKEVIILPNFQWMPLWPGLNMINPFGTNILSVVKRS